MNGKGRLKLDKTALFSLLIGVGIFLFNSTLRNQISQSIIMSFNIPVYIAFLFFLPKS